MQLIPVSGNPARKLQPVLIDCRSYSRIFIIFIVIRRFITPGATAGLVSIGRNFYFLDPAMTCGAAHGKDYTLR